jgi:hypothetical protein
VPLSEHEQRLLDQIERALYQEDPKFASTVRQTDLRTHMRRPDCAGPGWSWPSASSCCSPASSAPSRPSAWRASSSWSPPCCWP